MTTIEGKPRDDLAERVTGLPHAVARDPALLRRGRHLNTTCLLRLGDRMFLLRVVDGDIAQLRPGPFVTPSCDFSIAGDEAVWRRLFAAEPPPGDHDLLAFVKRGELQLAGDLHPLMSHLLYWKGVLACLKEPT